MATSNPASEEHGSDQNRIQSEAQKEGAEDAHASRAWMWILALIVVVLLGGVATLLLVQDIKEGAESPSSSQVVRQAAPTGPARQIGPRENIVLPMASQLSMDKWPQMMVPAKGDSARVPIPPGMHITFAGSGFSVVEVYADGHKCVIGNRCVDGPLIEAYAHNETNNDLIAAYAFARKGE